MKERKGGRTMSGDAEELELRALFEGRKRRKNLAAMLAVLHEQAVARGFSDWKLAALSEVVHSAVGDAAEVVGISRKALLTMTLETADEVLVARSVEEIREGLIRLARDAGTLDQIPAHWFDQDDPRYVPRGVGLIMTVLDALVRIGFDGPWRTRQIADQAGLAAALVEKVLVALRDDGFVVLAPRKKHAPLRWSLPGNPPDARDTPPPDDPDGRFYLGGDDTVYGSLAGGWVAAIPLRPPVELWPLLPEAGVYRVSLYKRATGRDGGTDIQGAGDLDGPPVAVSDPIPGGLLAACGWAKAYAKAHRGADTPD